MEGEKLPELKIKNGNLALIPVPVSYSVVGYVSPLVFIAC